jgi:hypothetical protein
MPLTKAQSLLFACQAMNPFVNDQLLQKDSQGNPIPTSAAPGYPVAQVLADLHQNDQDYGLHAIDHILDSLHIYSKEAGYSLAMGPNELLDNTAITTIARLGGYLRTHTSKLV